MCADPLFSSMIYEIEYLLPQVHRVEASSLAEAAKVARKLKGNRGLLTRVTQVDPPLPPDPEEPTPLKPPPGGPPTGPTTDTPTVQLEEFVEHERKAA